MSRSITSLLVASVLTVLVAGCGSTPESPTTRPTTRPADQVAKPAPRPSVYSDFGEPLHLQTVEVRRIEDVVALAPRLDGEFIRVQGKVSSVCARKGCWLRLAPEGSEREVMVKFTCPVDGRLIPMEAVGHLAIVEGVLEVTTVSEDEARHYAEEAGQSPAEIARIVGEQRTLRIQAPAARILGLAPQS